MRKLFFALFVGLTLAGCSNSVKTEALAPATENVDYSKRMMSYSVSVDLKVKNKSAAKTNIADKTTELKGYVVETSRTRMVLNIPSRDLATFIDYLEDVGTITEKDKYGKDVTESYDEITAKLSTLKASRESYMALLKKATAVDDILKIEKELERVNGEIQRLETQKLRIQNSIEYSKVTIIFQEDTWVSKTIVGSALMGALVLLIVL